MSERLVGADKRAYELRAEITTGTKKGEIFSVMIERRAERLAVAALIRAGLCRLVTFGADSVQLERIVE